MGEGISERKREREHEHILLATFFRETDSHIREISFSKTREREGVREREKERSKQARVVDIISLPYIMSLRKDEHFPSQSLFMSFFSFRPFRLSFTCCCCCCCYYYYYYLVRACHEHPLQALSLTFQHLNLYLHFLHHTIHPHPPLTYLSTKETHLSLPTSLPPSLPSALTPSHLIPSSSSHPPPTPPPPSRLPPHPPPRPAHTNPSKTLPAPRHSSGLASAPSDLSNDSAP